MSIPKNENAGERVIKRRGQIWPAFYILAYFIFVGVAMWNIDRQIGQFVFLALVGLLVGSGFLIHALARPSRKPIGRKVSLAIVGLSLFLSAGVFGRQSFQLEGFFFHVLAGVFGGVVTHYFVAKIAGPVVIGRAWCAWGCWIWMVLDRLPWKKSPGRRSGWHRVRTAHFLLSLGLVAFLAFGLKYDHGFEWTRIDGLWWFLGGCAVYYTSGVVLAFFLKDNRAFCKYLCPITLFLRAGNRVSLLKVTGAREGCARCGSCDRVCPMDVNVSSFVSKGTRVLDPECTLCQTCVGACPRGNLGLSLGLDVSPASTRACQNRRNT